tara:strand:+ start:266 stop:448 length:183 start_codon:yes stop_codon:yes gene_type:complete
MTPLKEKLAELEAVIDSINQKHKEDNDLLRSMFEYLVLIGNKSEKEFDIISKITTRLDIL